MSKFRERQTFVWLLLGAAIFWLGGSEAGAGQCDQPVVAEVVAIDQAISVNRLGASIPGGMIFALKSDVCAPGSTDANGIVQCDSTTSPSAGNAMLKPYKRPRPLVLRVNQGDCLRVGFTNWVAPSALSNLPTNPPISGVTYTQPATRELSVHVQGLNWVRGPQDDGSYVGTNASSLVAPGDSTEYVLFADNEGTFLLYSTGDTFSRLSGGNNGDGGTLTEGLFGAVHVEPATSEWFRSQVTEQDLCWASLDAVAQGDGSCARANPDFHPQINYYAVYPSGPRQGLPVLSMLCNAEVLAQPGATCTQDWLYHSDLTALITGPGAGGFPPDPIPGSNVPSNPTFRQNYPYPDRVEEPYREFTIVYHESYQVAQAFPYYYQTNIGGGATGTPGLPTVGSVSDAYGINYGFGGLGSAILANRLEVGPLDECIDCKYEEFFLSSWTQGDPAMPVAFPSTDCVDSNGQVNESQCTSNSQKNFALYQDDP